MTTPSNPLQEEGGKPKMPRPWFRASSHNFGMGMILHVDGALGREGPLLPGERRLGWLVLPPFQRPAVWTVAQQIRFIESAWSGLPLGSLVYNRTPNNEGQQDGWLLDGQQRINAVLNYTRDAFQVAGSYYGDLTATDHRHFSLIPFSALETHLTDTAAIEEVYDRLAYGGTPHEPKPYPLTNPSREDNGERG